MVLISVFHLVGQLSIGTYKDNGVITLIPPNNYDLFGDKMTFGMEKLQSNMSLHEYSNQALKILSNVTTRISLYRFKSLRIIRYDMGEDIVYS